MRLWPLHRFPVQRPSSLIRLQPSKRRRRKSRLSPEGGRETTGTAPEPFVQKASAVARMISNIVHEIARRDPSSKRGFQVGSRSTRSASHVHTAVATSSAAKKRTKGGARSVAASSTRIAAPSGRPHVVHR